MLMLTVLRCPLLLKKEGDNGFSHRQTTDRAINRIHANCSKEQNPITSLQRHTNAAVVDAIQPHSVQIFDSDSSLQ
eukprot:scaffold5011_cov143-Skeletonema_menzelii.AAC.3